MFTRLLCLIAVLVASDATAGTISRPTKSFGGTSFINGVVPQASDFNGDIDTIYSEFNGNISNVNIASNAAIAASKLDVSSGFTTNIRTLNSEPCKILDETDQPANSRRWAMCVTSGKLQFGSYADNNTLQTATLLLGRSGGMELVGSITGAEFGSEPAAPASGKGLIFWRDNGFGLDLMAKFSSGESIVLATKDAGGPRIKTTTISSSHTLAASDAGKMLVFNSSSAMTLTVPSDTSPMPIGTQVLILQWGTGAVTISGAVHALNGTTKTAGQYAVASIVKVASNAWSLSGALVVP